MSQLTDFYVELLDDKEADLILAQFKEKVPGFSKIKPNLDLKKSHIKKIFTKQTSKTKGKSSEDPFMFHIRNLKLEDYTGLDCDEIIADFNIYQKAKITDSQKLAILFKHCNNELLVKIPEFKEKIEGGIPPFKVDKLKDVIKEPRDFIKKQFDYDQENFIDKALDFIEKSLSGEDQKVIKKLTKKFSKMSLEDIFYQIVKLKEDYPLYIIHFSYLRSHPDEESIVRLNFFLQVFFAVINEREKEITEYKFQLENSSNDQEKFTSLEKKLNDLEQTIKKQQKMIGTYKKDITDLTDSKENYEKALDNSKQTINNLQSNLDEANVKNKKFEIQFELLQSAIQDQPCNDVLLIYTGSEQIIKTFHPDIIAITFENIERVQEVLLEHYQIKKILIQRDGLCSEEVRTIETIGNNSGARCYFFTAVDNKELMEQVFYYKKMVGGY